MGNLINSIGVDIEQIKRFKNILNNSHFLNRCFTKKEIDYCKSKSNPAQHFAARFAAKEALVKATNNKKIGFSDIEILNDKTGKPYCKILNKKYNLKSSKILVSLAHDLVSAIAFVLIKK